MKEYSKFNLALAVSSALFASQVAAFGPVWPADGDNANGVDPAGSVVLWHSGASASTSSVQTAVVEAFCETDNVNAVDAIDILEDARALGKPEFWSVACIGKATLPSTLAGKKIIWSKRDEGGSGVGVAPLALGKAISFMKPSTGAGTNCPSISSQRRVIDVGAIGSSEPVDTVVNVWNCTGFAIPATVNEADATVDAVVRVPDLGTSDIEPDKFASTFAENVSNSDFDLDGTRAPTDPDDVLGAYDATGLTKEGLAQLLFGVPVNVLMYQDLQRAQFPGDGPGGLADHPLYDSCNPAGLNYGSITSTGANANKEMCMPSLTGDEIRSIIAKNGAIRSAADFQKETAFQSGTFASITATGTTDQTIQICRRVRGSGTQAQMNAIFLGYPCDATGDGSIDTLLPEGRTPLTTFVTEGESSGDVEKCLNDFNDGTNTTGDNASSRTRWAIGVNSMEKNNTLSNRYRFVKVDGFAPTLLNAHAGDYYDIARQTLQYKTAGVPTVTVDAFNAFKVFLADPLKLPSLNKSHPFGTSGWLGAPSAAVTPDSELNFTRPVSWMRRVSVSGTPNTCALASAFKKTGGTGTDITVAPQNCSADNGSADGNCYTP